MDFGTFRGTYFRDIYSNVNEKWINVRMLVLIDIV